MTLFDSLTSAAKLAIAHDNIPGEIVHSEWAKTYRCSVEDVREALTIAQNGSRKLPEEAAAFSKESAPTIDGEGK